MAAMLRGVEGRGGRGGGGKEERESHERLKRQKLYSDESIFARVSIKVAEDLECKQTTHRSIEA
eukprot:757608-Hanusia_phi.AAC.3